MEDVVSGDTGGLEGRRTHVESIAKVLVLSRGARVAAKRVRVASGVGSAADSLDMNVRGKLDVGIGSGEVFSLAGLKDRNLGAEEGCGVDQGGGGESGDKKVEKHAGEGDEEKSRTEQIFSKVLRRAPPGTCNQRLEKRCLAWGKLASCSKTPQLSGWYPDKLAWPAVPLPRSVCGGSRGEQGTTGVESAAVVFEGRGFRPCFDRSVQRAAMIRSPQRLGEQLRSRRRTKRVGRLLRTAPANSPLPSLRTQIWLPQIPLEIPKHVTKALETPADRCRGRLEGLEEAPLQPSR